MASAAGSDRRHYSEGTFGSRPPTMNGEKHRMDIPNTTVIARFQITRRQCLDVDGKVLGSLHDELRDKQLLVQLYRAMVLTRMFDAKAVSLQRTGRLGTYATSLGQEAVGVGAASAMRKEDVFLPSYRETGALLVRGVKLEELLLYWGGDERGSDFQEPREDFPIAVPVGSQALHAAGVAYAFKLRRQPRVAVCMFGDGATSKGDVYEALNFAGVWKLPVVFVVCNNQWAISVPLSKQTAAETLAQKAIGVGIEAEQVDGDDVIAVRSAMDEAITAARHGAGPRLIEAVTYRLGDHTTADDASRYRPSDEVSEHWQNDPIARLRSFLVSEHAWTKSDEEALTQELQAKVEAAVEIYLAWPQPAPQSMFDYLYHSLALVYETQRESLKDDGND